ncbi:hypothetical protein [Marinobacter manganoxydans]|uniref:Uncharacterized protein n=1 Tax=Marinobacter manganoxydans MnI7-9 TaxID=1094979 RepID=G6YWQ9_9GAMM|nr:hypothetical protein [Marinobacter manganoxydans]EHJ03453.1 hypothetical protein KYE_16613 [Marinobacter manganoxydans MnI7-9]
MKWILILTLANAGTSYDGKAIHSVSDFASQPACEHAGDTWKAGLDGSDKELASWVCVPNKIE